MPMGRYKPMICECRRSNKEAENLCEECQRREFLEWRWEKQGTMATIVYNNDDRDIFFSPGFSVGTVAVRGTKPLKQGYHHYWEIQMGTEVYGTDMMIGIATEKINLRKYSHNFVSMLGIDDQSWGLSYTGEKRHGGVSHPYCRPFGQNAIVGIHLDLWTGTLEFYIDRKPLGVAFTGLRDKIIYPIISSTAARSGMNLLFCRSYPPSLQLQAMLALSQHSSSPIGEEENAPIFNVLTIPPGMKVWMKSEYWWIVSCMDRERKRVEELNNRAIIDANTKPRRRRDSGEWSSDFDTTDDEKIEEAAVPGNSLGKESKTTRKSPEPHSYALEIVRKNENRSQQVEGRTSQPSNLSTWRSLPQQQCTATQSSSESLSEGGGTSCMRLLAATTAQSSEFMGRISPIFVGMPEGGFSVLSQNSASASAAAIAGPSGLAGSASRSRSVPAKASTSGISPGIEGIGSSSNSCGSSKVIMSRLPSTSEDDDDSLGSSSPSARREPKRLKLRTSIDEANDKKDHQNDNDNDNASTQEGKGTEG